MANWLSRVRSNLWSGIWNTKPIPTLYHFTSQASWLAATFEVATIVSQIIYLFMESKRCEYMNYKNTNASCSKWQNLPAFYFNMNSVFKSPKCLKHSDFGMSVGREARFPEQGGRQKFVQLKLFKGTFSYMLLFTTSMWLTWSIFVADNPAKEEPRWIATTRPHPLIVKSYLYAVTMPVLE